MKRFLALLFCTLFTLSVAGYSLSSTEEKKEIPSNSTKEEKPKEEKKKKEVGC